MFMTSPRYGLLAGFLLCVTCLAWATASDTKPQPRVEISTAEKAVLDLTNAARTKEKLKELKADALLFQVAREHAANLAKQGVLTHVVDGKDPAQRVKESGYSYSWVGENIAAGDSWTPETVFKVWMQSQIHRDNILDKNYREIGIGVVRADNGNVYFVQVFASPR